jgi:putative two-component system response regulator
MAERAECIFLVDDSIVNLNTGKSVLQCKYTVVTIPSGEKLLQILQKSNLRFFPDLILLDIEMPGMNGYDVIKKLKANPQTAEIPVIFLTVKSDSDSEVLGLSLGAIDYIAKPFSPPLLLKRIELHLLLQWKENELRRFNENLVEMVKDRTNEISQLQNAVILWAADMVEFRDEETGQHVERVQQYMQLFFNTMKQMDQYKKELAAWDTEAFFNSTTLHDVGKIKIPDIILLKKGKLTDEEFAVMKSHTTYGKMLIESLQKKVPNQTFLDYAKVLAYSHHERWDGKGYPEGISGSKIPLQARMMAFADVYDALVSERPYKKAFSHKEAMKIISEGRGAQFDPELTDIFLNLSVKVQEISKT